MKVEVVEYSPLWEELYNLEAEKIKNILGDELIEIHHIGSTSVKGLKAKPIIDILLVVNNIDTLEKYNKGFERIQYECMGEFGIPGRRFYRKGGYNRTHQIHAFEKNNKIDIIRHLAVRDYLRTHDEIAYLYGELKAKVAKEHPEDIEGYCDGKDKFVKNMEKAAIVWYKSKNNHF